MMVLDGRKARTRKPLTTNSVVMIKPTISVNEQPSKRFDFFDLAINNFDLTLNNKLRRMSDSQRSTDNSDYEVPAKQPSAALTVGLFALLAVWVISIAIGTVLFATVADWRKPLLVVLPMGLFLTLWAILLLRKHWRSSK